MDVIDGLGDVDLSSGGMVGHLDGEEGDVACELVDHLEGFLDVGLV